MGPRTINISNIILDDQYLIRSLNEDAVQRYVDLYNSDKNKPIKIQKGTNKVIDGFHRIEAAKRAGLKKITAEIIDIPDNEIRTKAYRYNQSHGVPLSKKERNQLIIDLYHKDGKTQKQTSDIIGLSERWIRDILLESGSTSASGNRTKNKKLADEDHIAIARLLIHGETQTDVGIKFDVAQQTISDSWSKFRDNIQSFYTGKHLTKKEIAKIVKLELREIDLILKDYEDPLNFEPQLNTWWPDFGLDDRFGQKHGSNIPAELVKNILALYTEPGDVILDPAAGGGVVIDVCEDMVDRKCYAYDLTPQRNDIKTFNLLNGPPPIPEDPKLIFFDPPYGPVKKEVYSVDDERDLANLSIPEFLEVLDKIFGYWDKGILVTLMCSSRVTGEFVDLPFETEKLMVKQGWNIIEHIVNNVGRIPSETGANVDSAKKYRWLMRKHIHILVGEK